jgi:hypothetical protein
MSKKEKKTQSSLLSVVLSTFWLLRCVSPINDQL